MPVEAVDVAAVAVVEAGLDTDCFAAGGLLAVVTEEMAAVGFVGSGRKMKMVVAVSAAVAVGNFVEPVLLVAAHMADDTAELELVVARHLNSIDFGIHLVALLATRSCHPQFHCFVPKKGEHCCYTMP